MAGFCHQAVFGNKTRLFETKGELVKFAANLTIGHLAAGCPTGFVGMLVLHLYS